MRNDANVISSPRSRRSFLKTGLAAAGAVGTGLLARGTTAYAAPLALTAGDTAILQFLAAGEALEADFYDQYNELGGIQDSEVPGGGGNKFYTKKLMRIDPNIPQYIHDIADDETSHRNFINAYLVSRGAAAVDLEPYRMLPGSTATGSSGKLRLTNLMQLTVDTSWWTRYRSSTNNPDVNPTTFEQAVPDLHNGQFTAIPRTDDDLHPDKHIQAIANTAAFHIPTVEQGGGSLRMALAQRATDVEVTFCCVGPAVLAVLGTSGLLVAARLEPYRVYFILASVALLGIGFWLAYRPKGGCIGKTCTTTCSKITRALLWIAALVTGAAILLPNFVGG